MNEVSVSNLESVGKWKVAAKRNKHFPTGRESKVRKVDNGKKKKIK